MPIAARGRKDPALAAALRGEAPLAPAVDYFVGRKPLKVGEETRQPGDPVPEAASWPRLESWINTGRIVTQPKSAESILAEHQARSGAQHEQEMAEETPLEVEPEVEKPKPPAKKAVARPRSSSPGRAQRVRPKRPDAPEGADAPVLRPRRAEG